MKRLLLVLLLLTQNSAFADDFIISTKSTTLMLSGGVGERLNFVYYGSSPKNAAEIYDSGVASRRDAYPTFGVSAAN